MFLTGFWWISKNVIWIFFPFVCAYIQLGLCVSVCVFKRRREISRNFLMFHCWSSQHCRLLISYFLCVYVCVLVWVETKGKKKERKCVHEQEIIDVSVWDGYDEDVWSLLFAILWLTQSRFSTQREDFKLTFVARCDKCIKSV